MSASYWNIPGCLDLRLKRFNELCCSFCFGRFCHCFIGRFTLCIGIFFSFRRRVKYGGRLALVYGRF
jgi:hypothetical protein